MYTDSCGNQKVTGIPDALKNSQAYPFGFGLAIYNLLQKHASDLHDDVENMRAAASMMSFSNVNFDPWDDAGLWDVLMWILPRDS